MNANPSPKSPLMHAPLTRRTMLAQSAFLAGGLCLCRIASGADGVKTTCCGAPDLEPESLSLGEQSLTIDLAKAPSLRQVGSAAHIINAEKELQLIVAHPAKHQYVALARLCTHGGQTVSYNHRRGVIQCNNHNHSIFDLRGQVVKGPAPKPLACYRVRLAQGKLEISLQAI